MATKPKNFALAAKLCWRFKTKAHEPWAQVLKGKYLDCARPQKYALSRFWSTILKGESICNVGSRWLVGNNCSLNFWNDTWLKIGNIRSLIMGPLNKGEDQLCINNLLVDGVWLLHMLSFDLPLHIALSIRATPIRIASDGKDTLSWNSNVNGVFDTKDAYLLASGGNLASHCFNGKWIWKLKTLPKIQLLLWKCFHHSLPVKESLLKRGIILDPMCDICHADNESLIYVLRDCSMARNFWIEAGNSQLNSDFFDSNCLDWIKSNALNSCKALDK
jgi:hypothetical protein